MKSFTAIAILGACSVAQAYTYVGCSSTAVSSFSTTGQFMSYGQCEYECKKQCGAVAMAISGTVCHCGKLPAQSDLVDDAKCNTPCPGYDADKCGGDNTFSVFSL
ncbi:WSC-domain-containing protein [Apiospora arundinis]|uniref:Protein SLG1 n=1 Tax=Apiospora arundinis TaxID=335852 RepID=A0ABR2HM54_9PEZI